MERIRLITEAKRRLLEADNAWADYSPQQTAEALAQVEKLDGDVLERDFSEPGLMLLGLEILLAGNDTPNFSDDFKNKLFDRLREASHKKR